MIMNITRSHNGPTPPELPWHSTTFDPHNIEAMANELYGMVPGRSSVTNQGNQAVAAGEATTPTPQPAQIPIVADTPSMTQPEAPAGVPSFGIIAVENPTESDPLSVLAQQLSAQMSSFSLDPSMQQAIAGLDSAAFYPEGKESELIPLDKIVQELSAQMSSLLPSGTLVESNPSPKSETGQSGFYFLSAPEVEDLGLEPDAPFDVEVIRRDFPILHQKVNGKPLIWLDNAATTQKPQSVIDAVSRFYERDNSNIHRGAHTLAARATDAYEAARETVQRFFRNL